MNQITCPSPEQLQDYAVGKIPEEESAILDQHIDECPACQALIVTLDDAEDTLLTRIRRAPAHEEYEQEPEYARAAQKAKALVSAKVAAAANPNSPASEDIGDLGQLGEYALLAKLGEGGMGAVYKALQTKLDKIVAVKVLPKSRMEDERAMASFEREMKAVGRLNHPNIVQAHDAREIDGTSFLVMEYVEGPDLSELIDRLEPLPVPDACELIRQAAVGLQYAHENSLVHRDIKPSNLMLTTGGQVKILDLGLALLGAGQPNGKEMTGSGQAMGTADYMAPEQTFDSHSVDIRADIYSLGCTLYKLLSGHAPFSGPDYISPMAKMMAHVQQPARPITARRPELPAELAALVDRMMAKRPEDRFAVPGDVAIALEPYTAGCDLAALLASAQLEADAPETDKALAATDEYASSAKVSTAPSRRPQPAPTPTPAGRRLNPRWIAAGLAPLFFALGIIIWINRTRIEVPEGSDVQINADGSVHITTPKVQPVAGRKPPPLAIAPFDADQAQKHQQAWADFLGVPVEWTDSIGMKFVLIPPGEFTMGSTEEEWERFQPGPGGAFDPAWIASSVATEGPAHRVTITRPFYLGKYEVTVGQFRQCVDLTGYRTDAERYGGGRKPWSQGIPKPDLTWQRTGIPQTDDHPVVVVDQKDTVMFCEWLGHATGQTYRLPTEAEWEYACRGGTTTHYFHGDDWRGLEKVANVGDASWVKAVGWNTWDDGYPFTAPVGRFTPNPFGIHDMLGNVSEWCADYYDEEYYRVSPPADPKGPQTGKNRVIRGNSWYATYPSGIRCADRVGGPESHRVITMGFRVVCEIPTDAENSLPKQLTEREVIEWIYRIGGSIATWESRVGTTATFATADNVPENTDNLCIVLRGSVIIDDRLSRLQVFKEVLSLEIDKAHVTDEAMRHVAKLPGLLQLGLRKTLIGNAGLKSLRGCKTLNSIYLDGSAVSDDGMQHLAAMPWLGNISLHDTAVTDRGVDVLLANQPSVDTIGLSRTQVSDAALQSVGRLPSLGRLFLSNTKITDAGLEHLRSLSTLRELDLTGTQVTEAGVEKLRKALPDCDITWEPAVDEPLQIGPPMDLEPADEVTGDEAEERTYRPPVVEPEQVRFFEHQDLYKSLTEIVDDGRSDFMQRLLYTEIAATMDREHVGSWRLGPGMTRDGQACELSVKNAQWFARKLPEAEARELGLSGNQWGRTIDVMWKPPVEQILQIEAAEVRVETDAEGNAALVGTIRCKVDAPQRVDYLALVLSSPSAEEGEDVNREVYQYVRPERLPGDTFQVNIPLGQGKNIPGAGRFYFQAFLFEPKASFYRISNELMWTGESSEADAQEPAAEE